MIDVRNASASVEADRVCILKEVARSSGGCDAVNKLARGAVSGTWVGMNEQEAFATGVDLGRANNDKCASALMYAAEGGHAGAMRALLDGGADPEVCRDDGLTPTGKRTATNAQRDANVYEARTEPAPLSDGDIKETNAVSGITRGGELAAHTAQMRAVNLSENRLTSNRAMPGGVADRPTGEVGLKCPLRGEAKGISSLRNNNGETPGPLWMYLAPNRLLSGLPGKIQSSKKVAAALKYFAGELHGCTRHFLQQAAPSYGIGGRRRRSETTCKSRGDITRTQSHGENEDSYARAIWVTDGDDPLLEHAVRKPECKSREEMHQGQSPHAKVAKEPLEGTATGNSPRRIAGRGFYPQKINGESPGPNSQAYRIWHNDTWTHYMTGMGSGQGVSTLGSRTSEQTGTTRVCETCELDNTAEGDHNQGVTAEEDGAPGTPAGTQHGSGPASAVL
ncbi:hypothetical protein CYMTET_27355 [Cymbomonas tetramitiformis]|uniref:Ankyrin repeat protein n=1 Tax=Cymbomonas tetramitiformis TaxID=36881 RepID=A0AAE0KXA4_9CHLO|nr:hypothetical protein CYMTET_27355 [Cymbomonas tetramitiformis]